MLNLLKHEFSKLRRNMTFWVCGIILVGITFFVMLLNILLFDDIPGVIAPSGVAGAAYIAMSMAQFYPIIIAVLVASVVTRDYANGNIRNMVMSGKSRWKIFSTKLIITSAVSVVYYIVTALITTVMLTIAFKWGSGVSFGDWIGSFGHVIFQIIAFTAFMVLIADLTRSTGATLGIGIGLTFAFIILEQLAYGFREIPFEDTFIYEQYLARPILKYIGDAYTGNLIGGVAEFGQKTVDVLRHFFTGVAYLGGSVAAGLILFNKRDLK